MKIYICGDLVPDDELFSKVLNAEVSDTTGDDKSCAACNKTHLGLKGKSGEIPVLSP